MVTAKFKVDSIRALTDGATISLSAVTSGPGNESWSKWTPWGELRMSVTNPDAIAAFTPGKEYLIQFREAE